MNGEFKDFIKRIEENPEIDVSTKSKLINFICNSLFSFVRVFSYEEYCMLETILNDLNYDDVSFERILEISYKVRNSISNKRGCLNIPKANYVFAVHTMFKELEMDMWSYNDNFGMANIALARTAYKMIFGDGLFNNEISFVDLAKNIYSRYCVGYNANSSVCTILKYLHRIDKGFLELEGEYKGVVDSEEFYSMFECFAEIGDLHFSEIIKEYYPKFGNELFSIIKKAVINSNKEIVSTDFVMKYLNNVVERRNIFNNQKEKVVKEVEKIEVSTEKNIVNVFSNLIKSIENNNRLDVNISRKIIQNITNTFNAGLLNERIFIEREFDNLFRNCTDYVNDLLVLEESNKNGVDELINVLISNCKDFFVEYDSKRFKEIVDYILENTDISVEELRSIGEKCAHFFKEADIDKLKVINNSLKEFKDYISRTFKDSEFVNGSIFENILINRPELLLKNNKLEDLLGFLKGEISLDKYGYHRSNFRIPNDFLSYKFFKKMSEDNYSLLFESNIGKLINNLNYLSEKCEICEVDFDNFNFSEDMIYTLLSRELYADGTNVLVDIYDFFKGKDLQKLMELNPDLLMIKSEDLEIIVSRCMLNENDDYNFYDLLASELYLYKVSDFYGRNSDDLMEKEFKYVNLDIDTSKVFEAEELVTSHHISKDKSSLIWDLYNERISKKNMLNILLKTLETQKMNDSFSLNETVKIILDTYNELYSKVPNISFKNKIIDVINVKKEICEIKINDNKEELESKISLKAGYEIEKRDSYFVVDQLNGLIDSLDSEVVKKDLEKFLFKFVSERKEKSENKEELILSSIKKLEMQIEFLDREVEHLDYLLSIIDFRNLDIELVLEDKKFFNFSDLLKYKINNKSSEEQLIELVSGKNLILFADCVDLSEIPNDKNFLEKINKFLGDTEFSIQSQKFMEVNSLNNEFVKKLNAPREEIWSRRESRTPVRVYFIPIHCKYFTCYYVVNVTYKDHAHLDGGCSSDDVYKRRLKEAKVLERYINELEVDDLIEFVIQSKERYDTIIEPIVSKVELYNKRKGKK